MEKYMFILGGGLAFLLMTWWAIIDIALKEFSSPPVKIGWGIVVALVPFFGCLTYFIFGARTGRRRKKIVSEPN